MYLLDTCVLDAIDGGPKAKYIKDWFDSVDSNELYLPVAVLMEKRKGIEKGRSEDARKKKLNEAAEEKLNYLVKFFSSRICPIDQRAADEWGRLLAKKDKDVIDKSIAAIAASKSYVIVTKNIDDFKGCAVKVLDPSRKNPEVTKV